MELLAYYIGCACLSVTHILIHFLSVPKLMHGKLSVCTILAGQGLSHGNVNFIGEKNDLAPPK